MPGPLSDTSSRSEPFARRAATLMWPGPARGATACRIAFSTIGCNIRCGASAESAAGSMSNSTVSLSWKRTCSMSR